MHKQSALLTKLVSFFLPLAGHVCKTVCVSVYVNKPVCVCVCVCVPADIMTKCTLTLSSSVRVAVAVITQAAAAGGSSRQPKTLPSHAPCRHAPWNAHLAGCAKKLHVLMNYAYIDNNFLVSFARDLCIAHSAAATPTSASFSPIPSHTHPHTHAQQSAGTQKFLHF